MFPLNARDVPIERVEQIFCDVCSHGGYKSSTNMMSIRNEGDKEIIWVHSDICFQKWMLAKDKENEDR